MAVFVLLKSVLVLPDLQWCEAGREGQREARGKRKKALSNGFAVCFSNRINRLIALESFGNSIARFNAEANGGVTHFCYREAAAGPTSTSGLRRWASPALGYWRLL